MKRLSLVIVLCLVLALFTPMTIMATDAANTYELSELELSVDIPDKYSVITRETDAGDPVFGKYGISKESVTAHFETNNIYLNALSNTNSEEIVVTMLSNTMSDFNTLSDPMLEILASKLEEEFKAYNVNILDYEIYHHAQTKFLKIYFHDSANTAYGIQYYTICNYKAMNFTLKSYSGDITPEQESTIKTVVDSVKYNTISANSEQEEGTSSSDYSSTTDDPIMSSDNTLADVYNVAYKIGRFVAMLIVALPIIIVIVVIVVIRKKKTKQVEGASEIPTQQTITYDQIMLNESAGETMVLSADLMQKQMYVQPYLIHIRNNTKIALNKTVFSIGKDVNHADYCIMDNSAISRMHANIISRGEEYFVVDNNSTNHTYVNGMMIPSNVEVQITNGARIHFADEEFEFKVE